MSFFRRIFGKPEDDEDGAAAASEAAPQQQNDNATGEITSENVNEATNPITPEVSDKPSSLNDTVEFVRRGPVTKPIPDGVTRPLPSEPTYQTHKGHIVFGQASDPGMVRSNNQDAALAFYLSSDTADDQPDLGLFIVADGMGGHTDGEKASALTAKTVATEVLTTLYVPLIADDSESERPTIAEALASAAKQANTLVLKDVPEGGTTLTAVAIIGDLAHIVHVGDSRAYMISQDGIEQITRDHSLVQRLIELGQIKPEEAGEHPQRNVLYRAVGQNETLEVDTLTKRLPPDSFVLVCSDGLWGLVDDEVIFQIVAEAPSIQQACDQLVAKANMMGGHDNITAVLLKIPPN